MKQTERAYPSTSSVAAAVAQQVVHLLGMCGDVINSHKKSCSFAMFSRCWCIIWGAPQRNNTLFNTVSHFLWSTGLRWIKNKVVWGKGRALECLLFHPLRIAWADCLILSCVYTYLLTHTVCQYLIMHINRNFNTFTCSFPFSYPSLFPSLLISKC